MLLLVLGRAEEAGEEYGRLTVLAGAWAGVPAQLCALAGGSAGNRDPRHRHPGGARLRVPGAPAGGGEVLPLTTALQLAATRAERVVIQHLWLAADPERETELAGVIRWARGRWSERTFVAAAPLLARPYVVARLAGRAEEAQRRAGAETRRRTGERANGREGERGDAQTHDPTALLLVAPGGGAEANGEVARLARLLWEGRGWLTVEAAFLGGAAPDVAAGLDRCARLGATRVLALPLAAVAGATSARLAAAVDAARAGRPDLDVAVAAAVGTAAGLGATAADRYREALGLAPPTDAAHGHDHDHGLALDLGPLAGLGAILPPRYQGGAAVGAAPMAAADLVYDAEGQVAWDAIWEGFCDLALAGGPPHRGDLLLPPPPEEVRARPEDQARVLDELVRGLRSITGWPVVREAVPGWIGLVCPDAEAAIWLLRAIIVENVAVRREATTLFLPAGPDFRLAHEIKNVITVVAKTHHYWTEHIRAAGGAAVAAADEQVAEQSAIRNPQSAIGKLPRYEYECGACQTRFDVARSPGEAGQPYPCPFCGGSARRVFSAPKLLFKADPRDNQPVWHNHGGYGHAHAPGRGYHGRGRGGE